MSQSTTTITAALVALAALAGPARAADYAVRFGPVGAYGMIEAPAGALESQKPVPVPLTLVCTNLTGKAQTLRAHLSAEDLWGQPVARAGARDAAPWGVDVRADLSADASADLVMPVEFAAPVGYYRVKAEIDDGTAGAPAAAAKNLRTLDLGIVPPHHPGLRPDSFFGSNTSSVRTGAELKLLQTIGMKVQRTHFMPRIVGKPPEPSIGAALNVDFTDLDRRYQESAAADLAVLPIVGYSFEGANSELAKALGMHGPPRDYDEFVNTWELILKHYPQITTYEFWNEPWIFGWTWAGSGAEYRKLQTQWCRMALKVNPKLRIIAGNSSMFTEDHIEPWPDCWKGLLQGTTHHPYSGCDGITMRDGAQGRSIDHGMMVTRRMGLPYYYLTEGGTWWKEPIPKDAATRLSDLGRRLADLRRRPATDDGRKQLASLEDERAILETQYADPQNNSVNAYKAVQYMVRSALVGCYQGDMQWGIGYGPEWTRSNTTFALLTHLTEDRPVVAEIWPDNELLWGAIFANPRHVDDAVKALPRAAEFAARWQVAAPEDRKYDRTKVAVVWAQMGASNQDIDRGFMSITDAKGLRAFDCVGREILAHDGRLSLPLSDYPVYITTEELSVTDLRERVGGARMLGMTGLRGLNLYALSLTQPADQPQELRVRVENQYNGEIKGEVVLTSGGGKEARAPYTAGPGKLVDVALPWKGVAPAASNAYRVDLTVIGESLEGERVRVSRQQLVSVARFVKKTVKVDGDLAKWQNVTPVLLDSDQLKTGVDLSQYLLNPHLEQPTGTPDAKRIVAKVYTAYDDANVYVAVAVHQEQFRNAAGTPAIKGRGTTKVDLPYQNAMPDGLNHPRTTGDAFLFAFGFRDRVPGWGRQMDDPWAWKGQFYDTDYHYIAYPSTAGPQLIRQWGAETGRCIAYQTEKVPWVGAVEGAKLVIARDEEKKLTVYELSLPRTELKLFDPAAGRCRFGFILANSAGLGRQGGLEWSAAAGVFDHWLNAGSFSPSWTSTLPCQTYFGIEK